MQQLETAEAHWWAQMSAPQRKAYLREHPHSRMARVGPVSKKPVVAPNALPKATDAHFARHRVDAEDHDGDTTHDWNRTFRSTPQHYHGVLAKGTGLTPHTTVARNNAGHLHVTSEFHDKDGGVVMSNTHTFHRTRNGDLHAYHDNIDVHDRAHQGTGIAKTMMRNAMDEHRRMGVKSVHMNANIDVGGYAWAKYGWRPTEHSWKRLQGHVRSRLKKVSDQLPKHVHDEALRHANGSDTHGAWHLSDLSHPVKHGGKTMPLGKHLLLGSNWDGHLDLDDRDATKRYDTYVGKKP